MLTLKVRREVIRMKALHMVTFSLMALGALNWGLVGLFGFNLVETLLGAWPLLVTVVYVLIAGSAVYVFATHASDCKACAKAK